MNKVICIIVGLVLTLSTWMSIDIGNSPALAVSAFQDASVVMNLSSKRAVTKPAKGKIVVSYGFPKEIYIKAAKTDGASFYQFAYRKSGGKWHTAAKAKRTKYFTKLSPGKYYVKVRRYKKVNGERVYGPWSEQKTVTVTENPTRGQKNAAETAVYFSDDPWYYGRSQCIYQVEARGFTKKEIQYATRQLDKKGINWKANAVKYAKQILSWDTHESRASLKQSLLNDGYTETQAEYAVDKVW